MNASRMCSPRALRIAAACTWLTATSVAFGPGDARAADPAPATAATPGEADRYFEQGVAAQKANKLPEAEALFVKAWALKKTWDIAANLGLVELKQGKLADGAGHVAYAMANFPPSESDTTRANLTRAFDAARAQVAEIKVSCNVEGATVRVGGKVVGQTPLAASVFAMPGTVAVEISKDSYQPVTKSIEVKKGASETVKLDLVPVPVPTASATATVVPTGTATVEPPKSMVPAYVAGGAGLVLAIAGGVMLGVGRAERADADASMPRDANGKPLCVRSADLGPELSPECPALRSKVAEAQALSNAGLPMLIVGGVALAGGVAYFLWPRSKTETKSSTRVVPLVSTTGGGFLWTGSF